MKRHHLVYLDEKYLYDEVCEEKHKKVFISWIKNAHPFIVAKQEDQKSEKIRLGFLLPLEKGKHRVSLLIDKKVLIKSSKPPKLSRIISSLDEKWQEPLAQLIHSFEELKINLLVFGSAMWQYYVKKRYMSDSSDIDLLWTCFCPNKLNTALLILKQWREKYSLNIDGEVEFKEGFSCSWQELLNEDEKLIVRTLTSVSLELKTKYFKKLKGIYNVKT
ncbi:MAG: malonate decarboxylase holo-[acyl-carrier-protein] synthase [Arcobacter sp.]|nr:MAG: malonate decarboxylase holo-[acyl-carrier-protein] synthase [Arcobacter sp.]